jgi:multicomponent Na+:H+ antiporter subunit F
MNAWLLSASVVLLLSLALGLVRAYLGPAAEDRMMSVQLVGTTGVGLLILLSSAFGMPALVDVALVLALLAAVAVAALTGRGVQGEAGDG